MRVRPDTAPAAGQPQGTSRDPGRNWIDQVVQFTTVVLVGFAVLAAAGTPQPRDSAASPTITHATTHLGGR